MKLFVDDRRDMPKGFDFGVQSYKECIRVYRFMDFDFVSLDYHLGDGPTGLDILKWMKENGKHPSHINIHSDHIEGKPLMRRYAEENFPEAAVTLNPV